MAICVVANLMPCGQYGAGNIRTLAHIFADEKKRRFGIVLGQHVQQMHGVRIVRPIVERQRDLIRIAAMRERAPIKLRRRAPWWRIRHNWPQRRKRA